ncbi:hypothetical protein ACIA8K_09535 [Catenuloplanes sp. NPDC051500]|uniref:WXG100-like domain-containing protein n=1 Tax=Catenuloplanes sp. NPDC051500 TaxID=3363959 RepID=UPI0037AAF93C
MAALTSPVPHPLGQPWFDAPSWIREGLERVVGADWPAGDERAIWDLADTWHGVSATLATPAERAVSAAATFLDAHGDTGPVADAFRTAWSTVTTGDPAALDQLQLAADRIAAAVEECGSDIEAAKLAIWTEITSLVIDLIALTAASALTLGAATPAALAALSASRLTVLHIIDNLLTATTQKSIISPVRSAQRDGMAVPAQEAAIRGAGAAGMPALDSLGVESRGGSGVESRGGSGVESRGGLGVESRGGLGVESRGGSDAEYRRGADAESRGGSDAEHRRGADAQPRGGFGVGADAEHRGSSDAERSDGLDAASDRASAVGGFPGGEVASAAGSEASVADGAGLTRPVTGTAADPRATSAYVSLPDVGSTPGTHGATSSGAVGALNTDLAAKLDGITDSPPAVSTSQGDPYADLTSMADPVPNGPPLETFEAALSPHAVPEGAHDSADISPAGAAAFLIADRADEVSGTGSGTALASAIGGAASDASHPASEIGVPSTGEGSGADSRTASSGGPSDTTTQGAASPLASAAGALGRSLGASGPLLSGGGNGLAAALANAEAAAKTIDGWTDTPARPHQAASDDDTGRHGSSVSDPAPLDSSALGSSLASPPDPSGSGSSGSGSSGSGSSAFGPLASGSSVSGPSVSSPSGPGAPPLGSSGPGALAGGMGTGPTWAGDVAAAPEAANSWTGGPGRGSSGDSPTAPTGGTCWLSGGSGLGPASDGTSPSQAISGWTGTPDRSPAGPYLSPEAAGPLGAGSGIGADAADATGGKAFGGGPGDPDRTAPSDAGHGDSAGGGPGAADRAAPVDAGRGGPAGGGPGDADRAAPVDAGRSMSAGDRPRDADRVTSVDAGRSMSAEGRPGDAGWVTPIDAGRTTSGPIAAGTDMGKSQAQSVDASASAAMGHSAGAPSGLAGSVGTGTETSHEAGPETTSAQASPTSTSDTGGTAAGAAPGVFIAPPMGGMGMGRGGGGRGSSKGGGGKPASHGFRPAKNPITQPGVPSPGVLGSDSFGIEDPVFPPRPAPGTTNADSTSGAAPSVRPTAQSPANTASAGTAPAATGSAATGSAGTASAGTASAGTGSAATAPAGTDPITPAGMKSPPAGSASVGSTSVVFESLISGPKPPGASEPPAAAVPTGQRAALPPSGAVPADRHTVPADPHDVAMTRQDVAADRHGEVGAPGAVDPQAAVKRDVDTRGPHNQTPLHVDSAAAAPAVQGTMSQASGSPAADRRAEAGQQSTADRQVPADAAAKEPAAGIAAAHAFTGPTPPSLQADTPGLIGPNEFGMPTTHFPVVGPDSSLPTSTGIPEEPIRTNPVTQAPSAAPVPADGPIDAAAEPGGRRAMPVGGVLGSESSISDDPSMPRGIPVIRTAGLAADSDAERRAES